MPFNGGHGFNFLQLYHGNTGLEGFLLSLFLWDYKMIYSEYSYNNDCN